jgi:hypothetical protein
MRFMILRKADHETEAGKQPSAALAEAMMAYQQELERAGVLLYPGDGLKPSRFGARIQFHEGKPTVIDGPFAEAKELLAGYTIIQVKSREEAIEWVKRWPALDADGEVCLELRPLHEVDDFGDAFSPELREVNERLRGTPVAK